MEISEAFGILAAFAEGLPHSPADPLMPEYAKKLECSPEAVIQLKKALVFGASTLKSVHDRFGLPADVVMNSIAGAIEGMGNTLEQPNIFEQMGQSRQSGEVIQLTSVADDETPEVS